MAALEIYLPAENYLYSEQVDLLVSNIDKNPSAFIPYLVRLRQYDATYKSKLNKAIKKVEEVDGKTSLTFGQASEPETPFKFTFSKPKDEPELTREEIIAMYKTPTSSTACTGGFPIEWFKKLRPYSDEPAENPSHWKTVSNYVKLVPLFKCEETTLNTALLEMHSVKNKTEAMKIVKKFPADIRFVDPSIYTEEMIQIVLKKDPQRAIFIDKSNRAFIEHMMPQFLAVPNILDYIVLDDFLTERHLYELGVRTRFEEHDLRRALHGQKVLYVHALCHGELIGPMIAQQPITRYSSVPLGVCEMLSSLKMSVIRRTTTYENFVDKNIAHMKELIDRTHYSEDNPRYVAVKKLAGVVPKKTFLGTRIMNKVFSSLDVSPWHLNFLDIVTPTGKYNLFSLKPEWTLEQIVDLFPGKEIVLCDYSCSPKGAIEQDVLDTTGGKRTKRKRNRRKTKHRF